MEEIPKSGKFYKFISTKSSFVLRFIVLVSKPEKTLAQIESNHVENNRGNGILYDGKEGVVISKNRIAGNSKHGITLLRSNEITIQSNMIRNNLLSGLNIEIGVCCSIYENGIYDNKEYGISTAGLGVIKKNDVMSQLLPSLFIRSMANLTVSENRLQSWKHECLHAEDKCRLTLERNVFYMTLHPSQQRDEIFLTDELIVEYVKNEELVHRIGPVRYREGLTVADLCDVATDLSMDSLKPRLSDESSTASAPFFTSVQLPKMRRNQSLFCSIL